MLLRKITALPAAAAIAFTLLSVVGSAFFAFLAWAGENRFPDVRGHWAQSAIYRTAALGLFSGYPDGTFRPEKAVTQLEAVILIVRADEPSLVGQRADGLVGADRAPAAPAPFLRVPWGQDYVQLALERQILPEEMLAGFAPDELASRAQIAALCRRACQLPTVETAETTGTAPVFSDLDQVPAGYLPDVRAVAVAGIMSGYPDGTFRPQQPVTRAEMASLFAGLFDRRWLKFSADRRLEGWVATVSSRGGQQELELVSLNGTQKVRLAPGGKCFCGGAECPPERALNRRVEIILNPKKQAEYVDVREPRPVSPVSEKILGTVKSVVLGEESALVVSDLSCTERVLPLAWDATLEGKNTSRGFSGLRPDTWVEVAVSGGKATRVTVLDVKKISGTVNSMVGNSISLGTSGKNRPGSFTSWDWGRIVDKDGQRIDTIERGDRIQVTYLDPDPERLGEERVLEITLNSRPALRKVTGRVQSIFTSGGRTRIVLQKNKYYEVADGTRVLKNGASASLGDVRTEDRVQMLIDGAGIVMEINILPAD